MMERVLIRLATAILTLIEILRFYAEELLDKLRYLQLEIGHWSFNGFPGTLVGRVSSRM